MDESRYKVSDHSKFPRTRSESGTEYVHYPLQYEGLPEEAKLYAEQVLNETEKNKTEGMEKLKEFTKNESLTCLDDRLLLMVLRNCKYDIPKSKTKLKKFLKTRQSIINKITQMDMEKIEFILDQLAFVLLPWRGKQGEIIVYSRPSVALDKCETDDYAFIGLVQVLFLLQFPLSSIYGTLSIGDTKAPESTHLFVFNILRKSIFLMLGMPYRYSRMDIINEHPFNQWCFNMLSPLLPEKVTKRIMFHGSKLESLHKIYHPDILPEELGGNLGPISNKHYREELLMFIHSLKVEYLEDFSTDL